MQKLQEMKFPSSDFSQKGWTCVSQESQVKFDQHVRNCTFPLEAWGPGWRRRGRGLPRGQLLAAGALGAKAKSGVSLFLRLRAPGKAASTWPEGTSQTCPGDTAPQPPGRSASRSPGGCPGVWSHLPHHPPGHTEVPIFNHCSQNTEEGLAPPHPTLRSPKRPHDRDLPEEDAAVPAEVQGVPVLLSGRVALPQREVRQLPLHTALF